MSDIRTYEPLWDTWTIESLIGQGSFGKVYKIRREDYSKTFYSAVKIISLPHDESEIHQMRNEGLDETSIRGFYHALVADIINEIDLMNEFRGNSNIVSFEDYKVIEKTDEIGWDVLIRMELVQSLSHSIRESPLSHAEVVKLGIHICRALELCALKNTIHRDIKLDNIFVSQYGEYKLGDFGIARQLERTMSGLSKKGTYSSMAPEVFKGEKYGPNVDTYSLGIVMYSLLNQNRSPFLPDYPQPIVPNDRTSALQRRMSDEQLPALNGVDSQLSTIVLKACAYNCEDRFSSPAEMHHALESVAETVGYKLDTIAIHSQVPLSTASPLNPITEAVGETIHIPPDIPPDTSQDVLPDISVKISQAHISAMSQNALIQENNPNVPALEAWDITVLLPTNDLARDTANQSNIPTAKSTVTPTAENTSKNRRKTPLLIGVSSFAVLALILTALATFMGSDRDIIPQDVTAYCISINGQPDIILHSQEQAQTVLDELKVHYTNLAVAGSITVTSVAFEENIEIVETITQDSKIRNKPEALQALINGKTQTIEHTVTQGETVEELAQKFNITADAIFAENEGLTEESPLTEGTQIKLVIPQPYLHVVVEGISEMTEDIEYETEKKKGDSVALYTTEVQQKGEKGSMGVTSTYIIRNGIIIEKTILTETIIKQPVKEIIIEGTKPLVLNLSKTGITNEQLASLVKNGTIPPHVVRLELSGNQISDISPLGSLTKLSYLTLSDNKISNLTPLKTLTGLTTLHINNNGSLIDITPLKSLTNLTNLSLGYNGKIADIKPLQSLTNLTWLSIAGNNISDFTPVKSLKKLEALHMLGNPGIGKLDHPKVKDLKKSLPNCKIYDYISVGGYI